MPFGIRYIIKKERMMLLINEEELKPTKLTWKEQERYLRNYTYEHSSPLCYIKDLIRDDFERKYKDDFDKMKEKYNRKL
jgi:hypothetical protein